MAAGTGRRIRQVAKATGWSATTAALRITARVAICLVALRAMSADSPLVIAHRGASAYLPEHTLPAKALAHAMGADFIEQDVVLSSDGVPVVLHDIHLDRSTDVASVFPGRARDDGRFYAIDFTLEELRQLHAWERRDSSGNVAFPDRFPAGAGLSGIPTLAEEIALIDGLNHSRGRKAGLYIEMKAARFHAAEGLDLPAAVLDLLRVSGWDQRPSLVFLQSFEPAVLKRLRHELGTTLPLIQLIGDNRWGEDGGVDFDWLQSDAGLDDITSYAEGIGPWIMQLYRGSDDDGVARLSDLAERAHERGLLVHPYTFRADALPPGIHSFQQLHELFLNELRVDGIFTDFPDLSRQFIDARPRQEKGT
jgi:glycerophosphoryl diester phosphodiesterase